MKSFSFAKALTLGALVCFSLPIACGDDDDTSPTPTDNGGAGGEPTQTDGGMTVAGGAGGAASTLPPGISDMASSKECGADMCDSVPVGPVFIDPCCAGDACGLDTGFLALVGAHFEDACQPKGQLGDVDTSCPTTAPSNIPFGANMVPINGFVGCCRENGMCGVVVDDVVSPALGKIASLGLGCVDAAPFFPDAAPAACGAGGGNQGGSGNGGGAGAGSLGGAGAGGAGTGVGGFQ